MRLCGRKKKKKHKDLTVGPAVKIEARLRLAWQRRRRPLRRFRAISASAAVGFERADTKRGLKRHLDGEFPRVGLSARCILLF